MSEAGPTRQQPAAAQPEAIPATLSHGGRFIQYNIFGNVFEVTAKYKPPIMPIGKGAYGIVWSVVSLLLHFISETQRLNLYVFNKKKIESLEMEQLGFEFGDERARGH